MVKGKVKISVSSLLPLEARPLKADIITSFVFLLLPLIIHAQIAGRATDTIIARRAEVGLRLARKDIERTQRALHIERIVYARKVPSVHPAATNEETKHIFQSRIIIVLIRIEFHTQEPMNFLDDGARLLHISIFIRPIYANITERGARPNLNMETVELPPVQIILRQVLNAGITIELAKMPYLLKLQRAEEQGNHIISQARKAEINLQKINGIDHIVVYDIPIIEHDFSPLFDCQCTLTGNYPYVLR